MTIRFDLSRTAPRDIEAVGIQRIRFTFVDYPQLPVKITAHCAIAGDAVLHQGTFAYRVAQVHRGHVDRALRLHAALVGTRGPDETGHYVSDADIPVTDEA